MTPYGYFNVDYCFVDPGAIPLSFRLPAIVKEKTQILLSRRTNVLTPVASSSHNSTRVIVICGSVDYLQATMMSLF